MIKNLNLSENALTVIKKRYLIKDRNLKPIEAPLQMFQRVVNTIASAEELYTKNKTAINKIKEDFLDVLTNLDFLPNSPTFTGAGTKLGQLSACFVLPIEDDMTSILKTQMDMGLIHKSGGGTGFSFSRLRPKDDVVGTTGGISCGPLGFMQMYNDTTEQIKQGGCVEENTLIATEIGLLPIKKMGIVINGDYQDIKINVFTDEGLKKAKQFYNNGVKKVIVIQTKDGYQFTATPNHKIRIIDENGDYVWKELEKIKKGDWVALQMNTLFGREIEFSKFNKKFHGNTKLCSLPKKMDIGLAELIGYFVGDGCFHKGKLMLAIPHDGMELKKHFDNYLKQTFQVDSRVEQKPNDKSINLIYHSQMLVDWLKSVGFEKQNSAQAMIPSLILATNEENVTAFLRGLFEADGHIDKAGYHIALSSISEILIRQTQILLLALGIPTSIRVNKNRENSFGRNHLYILTITTPLGLKNYKEKIGFLSSKKKKRLTNIKIRETNYNDIIPNQEKKFRNLYKELILEKRNPVYKKIWHYLEGVKNQRHLTRQRLTMLIRQYEFLQKSPLMEILNKNQYYDQVKEISFGKAKTLDLVILENHTYIANGFVSHNTRRGANMGILRIDHPDVLEFINYKEKEGKLSNFNISVAITEKFMRALKNNSSYELINPRTKKIIKKLKAKEVFDKIVASAWRNGEPGVIFIDQINKTNPTPLLGEFEATNPCAEQPLMPYESCNLGSINLAKMIKQNGKGKTEIDWQKMEKTIKTAIRFLDDIIDINQYPIPEIEEMTKGNRKIGLGVMGFADLLFQLEIAYNSDSAFKLAEKIMRFVSEKGREMSIALAKEKGEFPNFQKSVWKKKGQKIRNAAMTTIAPTGTLSIIASCSSGIEPAFALAYTKTIMDGTALQEINPYVLNYLKKNNLWSKEIEEKIKKDGNLKNTNLSEKIKKIFVTAPEIAPEDHVRMQAAFQKYTDNAISKTINFANEATENDVRKAYLLAYQLNCKGITIYRDGSRETQVLTSGETKETLAHIKPRPRPNVVSGTTEEIPTSLGDLYVTINEDNNGPFEVFARIGKSGGDAESMTEAIGRLISLALRSSIEIKSVVKQLKGIRGSQPVWQNGGLILSAPDAIGQALERYIKRKNTLDLKFVNQTVQKEDTKQLTLNNHYKSLCPECGGIIEHEEGCLICKSCGYSKCG